MQTNWDINYDPNLPFWVDLEEKGIVGSLYECEDCWDEVFAEELDDDWICLRCKEKENVL